MMMSRKDYRTIAAAIREAVDEHCYYPGEQDAIENVAWKIADAPAASSGYDTNGNRLFDYERFEAAAGVPR